MSRFASQKSVRVDLGNEEWIDIRESIPFEEFEKLVSMMEGMGEDMKSKFSSILKMAEFVVKDWHILDDNGQPVPFAVEKLKQLDINTIIELQNKIVDQYGLGKKKEIASNG